MSRGTNIRTTGATLYFLPVQTRVPLKFGAETLTHVTCARAHVSVASADGRNAEGWGETPLSVQWAWPSTAAFEERHIALREFCASLAELWSSLRTAGHPIELGCDFIQAVLPGWLAGYNKRERRGREPIPWLAALVCCSPYDLACHDAYGQLLGRPVYETYTAGFMNRDLSHFLQPASSSVNFQGKYPKDFLAPHRAESMVAWHLVGGLDPLEPGDPGDPRPADGYPFPLTEWIERDGLKCLKVKLRGNDPLWDFERLVRVGTIAEARGVDWLSADFNCTVTSPSYVNAILDQLRDEHPRIYGMILYVEQPFPYELDRFPLDVHSVSSRKPLFLDESAHDWYQIRRGHGLGWSGVALKTCKTQSGALLSACWARAHGMSLMVQDLTNPMLAQIPHVLLAAHVGTIMGVETNGMQFYPDASQAEAKVHPDLYKRRNGRISLDTLTGPGFGYRLAEIQRDLPEPAVRAAS